MKRNKVRIRPNEIQIEMALKDSHIENILALSAPQIMSFITAHEFTNLVRNIPKDNIHFLALLTKLKYQFLDLEAYEYIIEIQHYIDND